MDLIEELIARETGKMHDEPERVNAFRTPSGSRLTYRVPTDADAITAIVNRAKQLEKLMPESAVPDWKPFLPMSPIVARGVAFLSALSEEPKLSDLDCLKLSKGAGGLFLSYAAAVQTEVLVGRLEAEAEAIDAAGEGSTATGGAMNASAPVAGSIETTPTA